MEVNRPKVTIVGCGPGSPRFVTDAARQAVASAEVLVGHPRLLELFPEQSQGKTRLDANTSAIAALLADISRCQASGRRVAVLVSGDPGVYSLAPHVVRQLGRAQCEIIPGISSVQVAFARAGLDWVGARILSAHGRIPQVSAEELCPLEKIAILAGTHDALRWSASLAAALEASHASFLAENLTLDHECFRQLTAAELAATAAVPLSMVLLIGRSLLA
jgi:cobalt-precorrin-7 (C5)-methyltransferase